MTVSYLCSANLLYVKQIMTLNPLSLIMANILQMIFYMHFHERNMDFDSDFIEIYPWVSNWQVSIDLDSSWWQSITWWRHQMETFSTLLAICAGNSLVTSEFPTQRPVTQSFDVFFDLHLIKRLSKQWWGWWFETPSCPLWRHCNDLNQCWPNSDFIWCH